MSADVSPTDSNAAAAEATIDRVSAVVVPLRRKRSGTCSTGDSTSTSGGKKYSSNTQPKVASVFGGRHTASRSRMTRLKETRKPQTDHWEKDIPLTLRGISRGSSNSSDSEKSAGNSLKNSPAGSQKNSRKNSIHLSPYDKEAIRIGSFNKSSVDPFSDYDSPSHKSSLIISNDISITSSSGSGSDMTAGSECEGQEGLVSDLQGALSGRCGKKHLSPCNVLRGDCHHASEEESESNKPPLHELRKCITTPEEDDVNDVPTEVSKKASIRIISDLIKEAVTKDHMPSFRNMKDELPESKKVLMKGVVNVPDEFSRMMQVKFMQAKDKMDHETSSILKKLEILSRDNKNNRFLPLLNRLRSIASGLLLIKWDRVRDGEFEGLVNQNRSLLLEVVSFEHDTADSSIHFDLKRLISTLVFETARVMRLVDFQRLKQKQLSDAISRQFVSTKENRRKRNVESKRKASLGASHSPYSLSKSTSEDINKVNVVNTVVHSMNETGVEDSDGNLKGKEYSTENNLRRGSPIVLEHIATDSDSLSYSSIAEKSVHKHKKNDDSDNNSVSISDALISGTKVDSRLSLGDDKDLVGLSTVLNQSLESSRRKTMDTKSPALHIIPKDDHRLHITPSKQSPLLSQSESLRRTAARHGTPPPSQPVSIRSNSPNRSRAGSGDCPLPLSLPPLPLISPMSSSTSGRKLGGLSPAIGSDSLTPRQRSHGALTPGTPSTPRGLLIHRHLDTISGSGSGYCSATDSMEEEAGVDCLMCRICEAYVFMEELAMHTQWCILSSRIKKSLENCDLQLYNITSALEIEEKKLNGLLNVERNISLLPNDYSEINDLILLVNKLLELSEDALTVHGCENVEVAQCMLERLRKLTFVGSVRRDPLDLMHDKISQEIGSVPSAEKRKGRSPSVNDSPRMPQSRSRDGSVSHEMLQSSPVVKDPLNLLRLYDVPLKNDRNASDPLNLLRMKRVESPLNKSDSTYSCTTSSIDDPSLKLQGIRDRAIVSNRKSLMRFSKKMEDSLLQKIHTLIEFERLPQEFRRLPFIVRKDASGIPFIRNASRRGSLESSVATFPSLGNDESGDLSDALSCLNPNAHVESGLDNFISIHDFSIIKPISRGSFGSVYLAKWLKTGDIFAIKVISKAAMIRKNQIRSLRNERDVMAKNNNPFVVRLYFSFQSRDNLYLVMEYVPGGDLRSLIDNLGAFEEHMARIYLAEVVLALEHLHEMGNVHRDLKPENILVGGDGHVKLTDFGLSYAGVMDRTMMSGAREHTHSPTRSGYDSSGSRCSSEDESVANSSRCSNKSNSEKTQVGTPDYLAPEILLGTGHGFQVDWWALGILAFEFLVGIAPFNAPSVEEIFENIVSHNLWWPDDDLISSTSRNLIERLLDFNPASRLGSRGAVEVREHPFFKDINWDTLLHEKPAFIPNLKDITDTSYFDLRGAPEFCLNTQSDVFSSAQDAYEDSGPFDNFAFRNVESLALLNNLEAKRVNDYIASVTPGFDSRCSEEEDYHRNLYRSGSKDNSFGLDSSNSASSTPVADKLAKSAANLLKPDLLVTSILPDCSKISKEPRVVALPINSVRALDDNDSPGSPSLFLEGPKISPKLSNNKLVSPVTTRMSCFIPNDCEVSETLPIFSLCSPSPAVAQLKIGETKIQISQDAILTEVSNEALMNLYTSSQSSSDEFNSPYSTAERPHRNLRRRFRRRNDRNKSPGKSPVRSRGGSREEVFSSKRSFGRDDE